MSGAISSNRGSAVHVEGLEELRARLVKLDKGLAKRIKETNFDAALLVAKAANSRVPIGTQDNDNHKGRLARSIRASATTHTAVVRAGGAGVPYAPPIHWGWPKHNIKPNPFLYDALDERAVEVYALYDVRVAEITHECFQEV